MGGKEEPAGFFFPGGGVIVDSEGKVAGLGCIVDIEGAVGVEVFFAGPGGQFFVGVCGEEVELEAVVSGGEFSRVEDERVEAVIFDGIGGVVFQEESLVCFEDAEAEGAGLRCDFIVGQHDIDAAEGSGGAEFLGDVFVFAEEGEGFLVGIAGVVEGFDVEAEE